MQLIMGDAIYIKIYMYFIWQYIDGVFIHIFSTPRIEEYRYSTMFVLCKNFFYVTFD
jgi:hypothetical protein